MAVVYDKKRLLCFCVWAHFLFYHLWETSAKKRARGRALDIGDIDVDIQGAPWELQGGEDARRTTVHMRLCRSATMVEQIVQLYGGGLVASNCSTAQRFG